MLIYIALNCVRVLKYNKLPMTYGVHLLFTVTALWAIYFTVLYPIHMMLSG